LQIGHAKSADRLNDIGFDCTKRHVHRHGIPANVEFAKRCNCG
jgi:hypothetical protein